MARCAHNLRTAALWFQSTAQASAKHSASRSLLACLPLIVRSNSCRAKACDSGCADHWRYCQSPVATSVREDCWRGNRRPTAIGVYLGSKPVSLFASVLLWDDVHLGREGLW
jgi:hypothetical protein